MERNNGLSQEDLDAIEEISQTFANVSVHEGVNSLLNVQSVSPLVTCWANNQQPLTGVQVVLTHQ